MKEIIKDLNIQDKIFTIRGVQVMLDRDLAELYGVETRVLNQAVKRNIERFPNRYMFQLTEEELKIWMSQIVISNKEKMGLRKLPYVFTEQGVAMLSSVLKSEKAIKINMQIIDIFISMRKFLSQNAEIFNRFERIEHKQIQYDKNFDKIFQGFGRKKF